MLKSPLLEHQIKTKEFGLKNKFFGDYSRPGTGKTLSAISIIDTIKLKTIIVCPPSIVENWLAEFRKHSDIIASPHFLEPQDNVDVIIVPYSRLHLAEKAFKWAKAIFADEAHYLKNLEAKRTKAFHHFFNLYTPEYFSYITGTPIANRIPEIYSMLLLFCKAKDNRMKITAKYPSFYTFCCRFTNIKQTAFGTKFEGMKNVEELRQYINPYTIRHQTNRPELKITDMVVDYKDNPELQKQFDDFLSGVGFKIDAKIKADSALSTAKFTAYIVDDLLDQGEGPFVIFSDHRKPLDVMEVILSENRRVKQLHGDIPTGKRIDLVNMLNNGQLDVLLCTIGVASEGFNMVGASTLVLNDPPWQAKDYEQLMFRINRIGSRDDIRAIRIVGSKPIEYIYKVLEKKIKVITKVIEER